MRPSLQPLFGLGRIVATPGALNALSRSGLSPLAFVGRHVHGDWGTLPSEDWWENAFSLDKELRILSSYPLPDAETKLWVITEADRSATTLLLPEEY